MDNFLVWGSDDSHEWVVLKHCRSFKEAEDEAEEQRGLYSYVIITGGALRLVRGDLKNLPMPLSERPSNYYNKEFHALMGRMIEDEENDA